MTELYVDPGHRLSNEDFAAVVKRAKEIREEIAASAGGGASGPGGIIVDWTARGVASKKYFPVSGVPTQLLVLHSAECPLAGGYAQSLTEWASSVYPAAPIASWQRFIDPLVRLRFIPDELGAWHASEANPLSIGWEQAGYARFSRAEWLTPDGKAQLELLAYDMAEVAVRDGIPARWLTDWEVRQVLDQGNRQIKGFCLHRQIDPETRTDPGDGYPYDLLMERIKAYMGGETLQEDTLSADMPMKSKDGINVTLETVLNSIDSKVEKALNSVVKFPVFDANVRAEFDVIRADRAAKDAQIAALTEAIKALASQQTGAEILATIEAGMEKFKDNYQVVLQRAVPATEE